MKFSVFQVSRKGGREKNEDRMGYCYTRESGLFALADGMGGHPDGEVAAQLALQTFATFYQKEARPLVRDVPTFLGAALAAAHHQIIRYASVKGMLDTPRTTLVAAVVQGNSATWIHCGDSRLYLVRGGKLVTRTRDHSYLEQHNTGVINLSAINRNILFTCLGSPSKPVSDIFGPVQMQEGDKVLLCSDGLWGNLTDDEIVAGLNGQPVALAVPDLVERALRNGGARSDNVTVVAFEWQTSVAVESSVGITTDSMMDGVFESTIQGLASESGGDELDDAAIERSIAEINEAIRRTAARRS